jgi:precorrin-2/cobalt-factor-2 C20-methyltransferase
MTMLIGLGLGPGDPELLTLKAVRILREADAVFVPGDIAQKLVAPYREAEVLSFPMTGNEARIRKAVGEAADRIARVAVKGTAVFALLGDPNVYSTYARLLGVIRETHPGIPCRTVPGVSSITAFASVAGITLSGGFSVSDGKGERGRILLKVRRPREEAERLASEGFREFVLVERMFLDGEKVYRGELPETSTYFSILYAER